MGYCRTCLVAPMFTNPPLSSVLDGLYRLLERKDGGWRYIQTLNSFVRRLGGTSKFVSSSGIQVEAVQNVLG
jgi:hypothetical protein